MPHHPGRAFFLHFYSFARFNETTDPRHSHSRLTNIALVQPEVLCASSVVLRKSLTSGRSSDRAVLIGGSMA
jgi:hypothetical protein